MLSWISSAAGSIGSWLGSGLGSFFQWLFGGLETILTKVVRALDTFWDLMDAVWEFATGLIGSIMELFGVFFPFMPPEVVTVISLALLAAAVAGVYKHVRR